MALCRCDPAAAGGEEGPGGTAAAKAGGCSHRPGAAPSRLLLWDGVLSRRAVYRYQDGFYRVDEVLFPQKPFLVMEWAGREEDVRNNGMEDTDPFPWDLGEEEILAELQKLLENGEK